MLEETQRINSYKNVTLTDLRLARVYYFILVELAKHKHCLTYGELVERAKEEHPENTEVQNAIAVSAGRRLDVVRMFTEENELPDLTALIISKSTGEVGEGFPNGESPENIRNIAFSYQWTDEIPEFDLYLKNTEKEITPRKKRKKVEATKLMSDHYQEYKARYPASIREKRDQLVDFLMDGFEVEESFEMVMS